MAKKDAIKKAIPPYVPFKTFMNFLESLKRGIPQRIDRSLMSSTAGGLQGQIMLALKYLNLITDTGAPTDKLEHLVHSEDAERQEVLKEILTSSYGFLFNDGLQLERATASLFRERFEQTGATGETLRKCMKFFLSAAKAADISSSHHIKKVPSIGPAKPKRISQPKSSTDIEIVKEPVSVPKVPESIDDTALEKMILDKMPDFNPAWPEDAQKSWLDTINKLMDRFQKMRN